MPKISQLPSDTSPSASDFLSGVQQSGLATKSFTLAQLQAFILSAAASQLLLNFGDGTKRQAVDDGQSHASPSGYFYIGKTLVQWASTTVNIAATGTPYSWGVNWPKTFSSVAVGFQSVFGGNSLSRNGDGTFEAFSTTQMTGFLSSNSGTETVTVYAVAIGT